MFPFAVAKVKQIIELTNILSIKISKKYLFVIKNLFYVNF